MRAIPFMPGQEGETHHQQQVSVSQAINGGLEIAYPAGYDTSGWPNNFDPANISGQIIRVTATGVTPPTGGINWTASNTKIPHGLGRQPVGWMVVYKNKTCDVFAGTSKPDQQFIYLTITDDTATTNILVF